MWKIGRKQDYEEMPPSREAHEVAERIRDDAGKNIPEDRKEYLANKEGEARVYKYGSKEEQTFHDANLQMDRIQRQNKEDAVRLEAVRKRLAAEKDDAELKAQIARAKLEAFERDELGKGMSRDLPSQEVQG